MTGVFLERATLVDADALLAIERASFSHPWTKNMIEQEIALGPPGAVLMLRTLAAGGRAEACAFCAYRVVVDEMHVLDLAVAPALRRRGCGRFLLGLAMRRAARAGAQVALLEVRVGNSEARGFYEALGFQPQGLRREYYRDPPEDALLLVHGLQAANRNVELDGASVLPSRLGAGHARSRRCTPEVPTRGLPTDQEEPMSHEPVSSIHDLVHGDEEYRQLVVQHHEYESRLGELAEKAVLSDDEQVEESRLKKKKLQLKDRMQAIARRYRG